MRQPVIDVDEFDAVAATCRRWSERSLSVARALIVDRQPLTDTANEHAMTAQQANVIRSRFRKKVEQYRITSFNRREPPARPAMSTFLREMQALDGQGYAAEQIVTFLAEHGVETDAVSVVTFLQGSRTKT